MLKLIDKSGKKNKQFKQIASDFYPYAKKKLGFDEPVTLLLISDENNAKNPLGKTAYYEPDTHKITIFVDNRHPKDMLRSFSHELVHHKQNCAGQFMDSPTLEAGYAQNDPHMREMETEAYLKGNGWLVRDYTDALEANNKMTLTERLLQNEGLKKTVGDFFEKRKSNREENDDAHFQFGSPRKEEEITTEGADVSAADKMRQTIASDAEAASKENPEAADQKSQDTDAKEKAAGEDQTAAWNKYRNETLIKEWCK